MQLAPVLFVLLVRALGVRAGRHLAPDHAYTAPNVSSTYPASTYCCGALEAAGFGSRVEYSGEETYEASIDSYWSNLEHLHPWCLIQPLTANEVSKIVATLVTASEVQECPFAVRSGGHTTWAGAANIEEGVTIDLGHMNSTTYHAENSTAAIQVGARWGSVYATLDALNVSSPGGRCDKPGVGGLVLGSGLSYFNARKGFVCDNVANFEVVLASGDIVNANSRENPDLFQVLKGGSNNFGIVTKVDMEVFDNHGELWGGLLQYPSSTMSQHAKAFTHFTDKIESDPNASTILLTSFNSEDPGDVVVFDGHAYTKPVVRPPIYDEYFAIPGKLFDTTRITNMSDLVGEVPIVNGWRQLMMTCTFQNDEQMLSKALELFTLTAKKLNGTSGTWSFGNQYHPLPKIATQHSVEKGGNVLGLERASSNLVVMLTLVQWDDADNDARFIDANRQLVDDVVAHSRSVGKANEWLYLNYAWGTQDVLASYGPENMARMRAASAKYDPDGVFQRLVPGGFKLPQ